MKQMAMQLGEGVFHQPVGEIEFKYSYEKLIPDTLAQDECCEISQTGIYTAIVHRGKMECLQGWKIHISSNVRNAKEILEIIFDLYREHPFSFKFIRSEELLVLTTQKNYAREQAGKFITIYPQTEDAFVVLLEKLYDRLQSFEGPYILTDKRYKDCNVLYYRYGAHRSFDSLDGQGALSILAPDGSFEEDIRGLRYTKPDFVEEVIPQVQAISSESYLFQHYSNIHPIVFSNSGGVYTANLEGQKVVIKEARPHTCVSVEDDMDAIDRRKMEARLLKEFAESRFFLN